MGEPTLAVPAVALLMAIVSVIIGRRITDPSAEISRLAADIEEATRTIRQSLSDKQFRQAETKTLIAEQTHRIATLTADLRELQVCKQVYRDANQALVLTLALLVPLVFLLIYPALSTEDAGDYEPLVSAIGVLMVVCVVFLATMSLFYFLIYRLHRR